MKHPPAKFAPFGPAAFGIVLAVCTASIGASRCAAVEFEVQQIADDLTVGYAVSLVDVDGDGLTDIVVVDSDRLVWYRNPNWEAHPFAVGATQRDNVCLAPHDIDGDGRIDFALGADWRPFDTQSGGTIQWITRGTADSDSWQVRQIGEEPTVHRMRWIDLEGRGQHELVVVPLMGRGTTRPEFAEAPVRILAYSIPPNPTTDRWPMRVLNEQLHVTHNFWPTDLDGDGRIDLLVTSFEGVNLLSRDAAGHWQRRLIGTGNQATAPNRGASEIKHGRLADGDYIATIEPWHGFQVVVYTRPDAGAEPDALWTRHVLDEDLQWGHAVWCADLDGDGDEELIIGVRDDKSPKAPCGLRVYDPIDARRGLWNARRIDPGGVAIEDLATADLDGDGRIDIVAAGRRTRNLRIYWNR